MYDDKKEARRNALWNIMFPEHVRPDVPKDFLESPSEPCPPHEGLSKIYKMILGKKGIESEPIKPIEESKEPEKEVIPEGIEPINNPEEDEEEDKEY